MKGHADVIEQLQQILALELTALDQYFIHARMYADWGLGRLEERILHEADEEKLHAQMMIDRILFLESSPNLEKREPLTIGTDIPSMLQNDLNVEYKVAQLLRDSIAICEENHDYQTRQILLVLLKDTEEDHMYWLEQQIHLISTIGLQNYTQSQLS
jgi:bacterioferritin